MAKIYKFLYIYKKSPFFSVFIWLELEFLEKILADIPLVTNPHKNNLRSQNGNAGYGINDIAWLYHVILIDSLISSRVCLERSGIMLIVRIIITADK